MTDAELSALRLKAIELLDQRGCTGWQIAVTTDPGVLPAGGVKFTFVHPLAEEQSLTLLQVQEPDALRYLEEYIRSEREFLLARNAKDVVRPASFELLRQIRGASWRGDAADAALSISWALAELGMLSRPEVEWLEDAINEA